MDSRASSRFALVRGCKDSSGLREFGFGHRISLLLVALVLILVIPHSASAQATATLNGVVRDSSGAVIPQATVTLQNTDTGTERESLTNDSGLYVFVSVPPGEYVLKVTKDGFTTATQGLHVLVNQASTLDFTLRVGSAQQSVTVEASAVNLETAECDARLGDRVQASQGPAAQRTKLHAAPVPHAGCESGQRGAKLGWRTGCPARLICLSLSQRAIESQQLLPAGWDR